MLKKINRFFGKKKEFISVKEKGLNEKGKFMLLKFLLKKDDQKSCFGVVVSSKIEKKAVKRNLISRRVYAATRKYLTENSKFDGIDAVFFVNRRIASASYQEIESDIFNLLSSINK